jgi:hypothetical protein
MATSPPKIASRGPHSRLFRNGSLGDQWDGRSREGKFLRRCESELIAQIGGEPSWAQLMLIRRAARSLLQLELIDARITAGDMNECNSRMMGGIANNLRLTLRELGVKAPPPKKPTITEYLARKQS